MRRSSFTDFDMRSFRHAYGCSRRKTRHGSSPLDVRPERSPLHDVRQHAHPGGPIRERMACAKLVFHGRATQRGLASNRSSRPQPRLRPSGSAGQPSHRFASEGWWSQTESNRRPPACKAGALPTELWPQSRQQQSERPPPLRYGAAAFAIEGLPSRSRGAAKAGGPGKI